MKQRVTLEAFEEEQADNLLEVVRAEDLHGVHGPKVDIAVWTRAEPVPQEELEHVLAMLGKELQAAGDADAIAEQFTDEFEALDIHAPMLLLDLRQVLAMFSAVSGTPVLRARLSPVNSNMCRRFHTDVNDLRLLCTYLGPGTLWLSGSGAQKLSALRDHEGDEDPARLGARQVPTGAVAILKGALYLKGHGRACVHRSPTVEETGTRRLLLRVDTNAGLFDLC